MTNANEISILYPYFGLILKYGTKVWILNNKMFFNDKKTGSAFVVEMV